MSEEITIERNLKKDEIPGRSRRKDSKFDKVIKSLMSLPEDEALEIKVSKGWMITGIRKAIKKHFKHNKFKVVQRMDPDTREIYCYIYKTNNN